MKWTVFSVLLVPRNSLNNADACMPLTRDRLPPPIKSTTGHYKNTGTHGSSLWLTFLAIEEQERALECTSVALNGTSTHCHPYQKYAGSNSTNLMSSLLTPAAMVDDLAEKVDK